MSSITIHDINPQLDRRLTEEAGRKDTSKNRLVQELLAQSLGMPLNGKYGDDYRDFAGLWSRNEREAFEKSQTDNQRVDEGDWRD